MNKFEKNILHKVSFLLISSLSSTPSTNTSESNFHPHSLLWHNKHERQINKTTIMERNATESFFVRSWRTLDARSWKFNQNERQFESNTWWIPPSRKEWGSLRTVNRIKLTFEDTCCYHHTNDAPDTHAKRCLGASFSPQERKKKLGSREEINFNSEIIQFYSTHDEDILIESRSRGK